jgi:acyl dehydratase
MASMYLDDCKVGLKRTVGEYIVEQNEIFEFARRWDPEPFHVSPEAAKASIFGGLVASSIHIIAIRSWLIHKFPDKTELIAGLELENMRFIAPVRPGDHLSLTIETVESRVSKTKPDRGIVKNQLTLTNQNGEIVLTSKEVILVARRKGVV